MAIAVDGYRSDDRHLVFRPSTSLSSIELSAKAGIIKLHFSAKHIGIIAQRHGLHNLVMQKPSCSIAQAKMAHQL
jgi:hypothetical protein